MKANVERCGVMHMRRKGVKRSDERFHVDDKEVKVVEEYEYLGCVVDEYLSNVRMAGERAKAGAKALSDWLRRCRAMHCGGSERSNICETFGDVSRVGVAIWGRGMGMWRAA